MAPAEISRVYSAMCCLDWVWLFKLSVLLPFALVFVGVLVAVFGKAYRNFPYLPDENRVFKKYALPRTHLFCFRYFDKHRPAPRGRAAKMTDENTDS